VRSVNQFIDDIAIERKIYDNDMSNRDRNVGRNVISIARFGFMAGDEALAVKLYASYEPARSSKLLGGKSVLLTLYHPEDLTPLQDLDRVEGMFKDGVWVPEDAEVFSRHQAFEGLKNDGGYFVGISPEDEEDSMFDPAAIEARRGVDEIEAFLGRQSLAGVGLR